MSDEVIKELPGWFVDRMREWARAILTPDGSNVPSSWPVNGPMGDATNFHRTRTPRLLFRVHDTDIALSPPSAPMPDDQYVQPRYAWAVREFWLYEGKSCREHARARGINHETFAEWVRQGHEQLFKVFAAQARRRKNEAKLAKNASEVS